MGWIAPERGYLERCWLYALRIAWATSRQPESARCLLAPLLQSMGMAPDADEFHRLLHALQDEGARYLYIESPDAPQITGDEADLLQALRAMAMEHPLAAEHALGALIPPGENRSSLELIARIAAAARRARYHRGCLRTMPRH